MQNKNKSGFTLIELLVVVLIVGILSAVALPQYSTAVEKARAAEALSLMNAIAESAERYCFQKDIWPTSNDFGSLDIEVPAISTASSNTTTTSYGGKSFELKTTRSAKDCTSSSTTYTITATRRDLSGEKGYKLKTVLQLDANSETIKATRSCIPNQATGKGATYCNAITNGYNDNF